MKNRFVSIIIIITCILMIAVGCSAADNPDKVVSEFAEAMKKFDFELMSSKINPAERGEMDDIEESYDEDDSIGKHFLEYAKGNAKEITYNINESEIDGNNAVVNVNFKHVDGGPLFRATFGEYMREVFSLAFSDLEAEITDEQYDEIFISVMEEQNELIEKSFAEKTLDIECIKIDDKWYIDKLDDGILDVLMANMISTLEDLDDFD